MNPKLIALLIRSNALMIEALKMADANAQERDGGQYVHETSEFNSLVADCEMLAKEAEEMDTDVDIRQAIQLAAKEGAERGYKQLNPLPIMPISPAHEIKADPLRLDDIKEDRIYLGKSENTGQQYTAAIKSYDMQNGPGGKTYFLHTVMLKIDGNELSPFDRPLSQASFVKEFLRWEK